MKDFFISYNGKDKGWAEWIAYQLEAAGYTTVIQAWDFRPGGNFVLEMQKAATDTAQTIAILSPSYLAAEYTQPEWAVAFVDDPQGMRRKLIPVRVAECTLIGLLKAQIYIDLVGKDEQSATQALLAGLSKERAKPQSSPVFPGQEPKSSSEGKVKPIFPPSLWNIPHQRNPFFTGREDVLGELHQVLQADNAAALSGLGGIGKTQTAVEYAYRNKDNYKAILWVKAESRETLVPDYAALAAQLDLPEKDEKDQTKAVHAVKRWLEDNTDWLLILDNADDLAMVREFIPSGKKGHVLLTTRAQATGAVARKVEVDELPPEQGALFLLRRSKLIPYDAGLSAVSSDDLNKAKELSKTLGGLPLALDQAAALSRRLRQVLENTCCCSKWKEPDCSPSEAN